MKKKASMDLRLHRESPYDIGVYSKKYKDDNLGMALTSNLVAGAGVGAATGGVTSGVTGRGPLRSASGAVFGGKDAIVSPKHLKDIKFYRAAGAGAAMAPAGPAAQAMAFAGNLDWDKLAPKIRKGALIGGVSAIGGTLASNAAQYNIGKSIANEQTNLEKKAFKEGKAKHFKKFRTLDSKDIGKASLRQGDVRKLLAAMSKGQRSQYVRDVNNANVGDVVAGTIWDVPGKGKSVGFSKKFWEDPKLLKEKLGVNRRGILAHEAFHANRPVLGRSEILAHAYGGAKDKKVRGIKDVGRASKRAAGQVAHLLKSRPGRFGFELGVLGAAATAGKMGYDRLTKPKEEVNKRNQMTAARALTAGAISNMYLPVIAGAARGEGFNSFDRLTTKRNLGTLAFTAGAALLNPEVRELYKKEKNA